MIGAFRFMPTTVVGGSARTKVFLVEQAGKQRWVVIRQIAGHDPQYRVGGRIPGYGRVIAIKEGM